MHCLWIDLFRKLVIEVNVYDFDNTIYKRDSAKSFYLFVIKRHPSILFRSLPRQIVSLVKYKLRKISKEEFKSIYFSFIQHINVAQEINAFIEIEKHNTAQWYLDQKQMTDVIISASPEFIVRPFMEKFDIENVIASKVDDKTGNFVSRNCYGEEKVKRFKKMYSTEKIDNFYSDSLTDLPLAQLAKSAYMVRGEKLKLWDFR